MPADEEGFIPDSLEFTKLGARAPVLSLTVDEEGNIPSPPTDELDTVVWWNQGPRPGSLAGKTVLTVHTHRNGGALGNELYDENGTSLDAGDLLRVTGQDGRTSCYRFTEAKRIWVEDYDPNSDTLVDFVGEPQLVVVTCWDFDPDTEVWDSRVLLNFTPA